MSQSEIGEAGEMLGYLKCGGGKALVAMLLGGGICAQLDAGFNGRAVRARSKPC